MWSNGTSFVILLLLVQKIQLNEEKNLSPNFSKKFQIFQMRFLITFNDHKNKNEVSTDRKWAEDYNGVIFRWKNLI